MDKEDFLSTLICHCYEANQQKSFDAFFSIAYTRIQADLKDTKAEVTKIYNPFRNLFLDKSYGENNKPLVDWMDFSKLRAE